MMLMPVQNEDYEVLCNHGRWAVLECTSMIHRVYDVTGRFSIHAWLHPKMIRKLRQEIEMMSSKHLVDDEQSDVFHTIG